nr:MAG TPA: hypothetical protein [Bacteriophage sp.]
MGFGFWVLICLKYQLILRIFLMIQREVLRCVLVV